LVVDDDVVEGEGGQAPALIEGGLGRGVHRRTGNHEQAPPVVEAGGQRHLVRLVAIDDVAHRPPDGPAARRGTGSQVAADGEGAGRLPGGDRGDEAGLLLGGAAVANGWYELGDGREEGPGRHEPPELFGDDGKLDEAETQPADVD